MSVGYGATAVLAVQDDKTVIFEYAPYNLNHPDYRNCDRIYDGLITISKKAFVEPEIHEKLKRAPGRKKNLVVKRLRRDVDYATLLNAGYIMVENSQHCWKFIDSEQNTGMMAMRILFHVFNYYQDNGSLPEHVSLNY